MSLNLNVDPYYDDFDPTKNYHRILFKPGYAVRYHKFGFRKSILSKKVPIFVPALTEWENMQLNGWDRIWDCGNYCFVML